MGNERNNINFDTIVEGIFTRGCYITVLFVFHCKMYHVLDELGSMSAYSFHSLENVDLAMLNDLFYARVSGTIDPATTSTIG